MPRTKQAKKERVTVSLSPDTVRYLEGRREETQAPSMSAYLESVVRDLRAKEQMASLEAAAIAYYDSLTPAQIKEESEWGRVGAASLSQFEA
jgi:hypothetical protein